MNTPEDKKQTPKAEENLNEDAQQVNAMAKAIIVSLTWSLAGLTTAKKNPKTKQNTSEV